jgi:gliding motility-associated-like protein
MVTWYDVSSSTNLYGITFLKDGKNTTGILVDRDQTGSFIAALFNGSVASAPSFKQLNVSNSLSLGQGISSLVQDVSNGNFYLLIGCSDNGNIARMSLSQFQVSDKKFSTQSSPIITYTQIGTFLVSLTVNKGKPSEMKITKQINVLPCPEDCSNNIDDDGNGLVDCLDPKCVIENVSFQSNTFCQGESVNIANNSSCVNSFQWIFGSGITKIPDTLTIGDLNITSFAYSKVEAVYDGANYYLFAINSSTGEVIQSNFGSSLKNKPTSKSLGIITTDLEGIQVKQDGSNWYMYLVGGNGLWSANFGNSLTNTPSISSSPIFNSLNSPVGLRLLKDYSTGNWHAFTIETGSNNIHRFDFGPNLGSVPSDTIIIRPGYNLLSNSSALDVIYDQSLNRWYLFVNSDNNLLRLNLGSYLQNNFLAYDDIPNTNLGDFNLVHQPSDIRITHDGANYLAYVLNSDPSYNTITKLTFPSGLSSNPNGQGVSNLPKLNQPLGMSSLTVDQSSGDQYFFIGNAGLNDIAALKFSSDTAISVYTSTVSQPSTYSYSLPGTYNLQLIANQGTHLEKTIVQPISVSLPSFAGNISLLSANETGGTLILNGNIGSSITWLSSSDSTANFSPVLSNSNQLDYTSSSNPYFKAIVQIPGCLADTTEVFEIERFIIYPTISPNGDNHNDTWVIDGIDLFPNNKVEIFNRWGSLVYETTAYNNNDRVWSGQNKNGGELPDGTYFYSIDLGNASKPLKGYLILRR